MNDVMRLVPREQKLPDEALKALEELVDAAKNGEFVAIAAVAVRPGDPPATLVFTDDRDVYALVGALEAAKLDAILGEDE